MKKIGRDSAQLGLYFQDVDCTFNSTFSFQQCNKLDNWHSRLGHPFRSHFDFIVKKFPSINANKYLFGDVCLCAKQSRPSFNQRSTCSSYWFELINVKF